MLLDTPICDFGWQAPAFSLADPDGKITSFTDAMGENGLLVAFICNHCPYVIAIAERLATDAATLQGAGLGVVGIMSNDYRDYPADSPANMKLFAQKYGFPFPYLVDEDQSVGKAYGAVCTPDFFGFDKTGGLQYRGRLDDAGMKGPVDNRVPELVNAMLDVAAGKPGPAHQTPSMGCSIKWSR
ncbi:MAG: thioredoxin family protein [Pseudomonadota bacterium]